MSAKHEEILRKLSIRDDDYVEWVLSHDRQSIEDSALEPKTHALVRLAALVTIDAAPPSYMWTIETARHHGATDDEIVGTLVALMPAIGTASVVRAAPKVGLALGYDVDHALEMLEREGLIVIDGREGPDADVEADPEVEGDPA